MNLQLQSQTPFGDTTGLKDFFFVHRLVHINADAAIAAMGLGNPPNAALDAQNALDAWAALMVDPQAANQRMRYALQDWLNLHNVLHQAEYAALNFGPAPDLSQVDFSKPEQYYDWMFAHSTVHDTLNAAVGITT